MAAKAVKIDVSAFGDFFQRMGSAGNGEFRREFEKFLEGVGEEFLKVVEDEIIRCEAVDTRLLLNSFHKGSQGNVWAISDGGLQLEVGTNVEYASYVNDGHWTNPKGISVRWVPGVWNGDHFVYTPGAKTGMLLKQKWIVGRHYFDSAIRIIERMMPGIIERKVGQWIEGYLGL